MQIYNTLVEALFQLVRKSRGNELLHTCGEWL
jgi:hypothetical protein